MSEDLLGRWPVTVDIPVAWGDMDALGHVNNVVYLRWFETGRIAYFDAVKLGESMAQREVGPILARQTIDYRLPLTYPDRVRIHVTVPRLGNTSWTMAFRITSEAQGGQVAAEGDGILVQVDYARGNKLPLSEDLRRAIQMLEASGPGWPTG